MRLTQLITAILLLTTTNLLAQAPTIFKATVLDSLHQPIEGATVLIKTDTDSLLILTDAAGKFEINTRTDSLSIRISRIGFYPFSTRIPYKNSPYTITLKSRSTLLKEIVVRSTPTLVKINGDTMQYNMDGVILKPNSVAEDVLKILPGLLVDQDGNIFYKGKKVSAIKINGKNIAVNDLKDITKLFPADAIKSIQLINEYTPLDRITGRKIDPSNNVLNIQTTSKKGFVLNAGAGAGTDERYNTSAFVNSISGPSITTAGISSNNTSPSLKLTETHGNINFATSLNSNLSLDAGIFFSLVNNTEKSNSLTTTQSDHGTLQTMDHSSQTTDFKSFNVRTNGEHLVNSLPVLSYSLSFFKQQSNFQTELLSTQTGFQHQINETKRNSEDNTQNPTGNLFLSHISKNGKIILSNQVTAASQINDNQLNEDNYLQFYNQDSLLGDSLIRRKTIKKGTRTSFSETGSFVYKFSPASSLELRYQLQLTGNEQRSNSFNLDSLAKDTEIDSLAINNKFNSIHHQLSFNYKYTWKKTNLILGAKILRDDLSLKIKNDNIFKRNYSFILPEARLEFNLMNTKNLVITYSSDVRDPSADQLNPIGNYSSPQYPIIGNKDLKPSQTHELSLNYTSIGKYNLTLNGSMIYYFNNIVSKADWQPNAYNNLLQVTSFTNVNRMYSAKTYVSIDRRFNNNKWGLALYGGAGFDHAITFIDGNKTINRIYQADPSFRINYLSKILEIQPSVTYAITESNYEGLSYLHTLTSNIASRLDAKVSLGQWLFTLQSVKQFNFGYAQSLQSNPFNCNAMIDYRFAKDRLTIKGSAFNIFNQIQNNTQMVGAVSVTQTSQVNRGRFFLLSLHVNLNNK